MRLFVAVEIEAAVVQAAMDVVEALRRRVRKQAPHARVTWVSPDRVHLTIAFIGAVDAARMTAIETALQPPLPGSPFAFEVGGAGAFPERGTPRVLWAGVVRGREALVALAGHVAGRLVSAGVPLEARRYWPHLTLGRVRNAAGLRPEALFEGLAHVRLGTSGVEAITLFESRLAPSGSSYVVRGRTPFRDA